MLKEDEVADDGMESDEDSEGAPVVDVTRCTLQSLFDIDNSYWKARLSKSASRELDEELDAYGLLDIDALGDEDLCMSPMYYITCTIYIWYLVVRFAD